MESNGFIELCRALFSAHFEEKTTLSEASSGHTCHPPKRFGEYWSIDFINDSLDNRTRFKTFNVIDDYNREALDNDIGIGLPSARVIHYLDRLADIYVTSL